MNGFLLSPPHSNRPRSAPHRALANGKPERGIPKDQRHAKIWEFYSLMTSKCISIISSRFFSDEWSGFYLPYKAEALIHRHTHTHIKEMALSLSLTHTHTHTHKRNVSLSLSHTHTHTHKRNEALSLSLSHTHTHT